MFTPIPFDTHAYVKRLIAAGMPEPQAEVQAEALAEMVLAQVVTKEDLRQAVADLERRIGELERSATEDLRQAMADQERRIAELDQKLDAVRTELKSDIREVRGEMREMELRIGGRLETELRKQLVWYFGMLVVLGGALVALLRVILPVM